MTDLQVRVELEKLSAELTCEQDELAFLGDLEVAELRALRAAISDSLYARHEKAFQPLASMTRMVPTRIAVKVAEVALGPLVSARIAGAVDTKYAASLAEVMRPEFLAQVAALIDPVRIRELVPLLPSSLVIQIGRMMLVEGQHLALSRFVPVVSAQDALSVIDGAGPDDTLKVALYCEDASALADIISAIDAAILVEVIEHAVVDHAVDDALTLITGLSGEPRRRVLGLAGELTAPTRAALLDAARRHEVPDLVTALEGV